MTIIAPPPTLPMGTVTMRYLAAGPDGSDTDTAPDLYLLDGATGTISPTVPRYAHTVGGVATAIELPTYKVRLNSSGNLYALDLRNDAPLPTPLRLPANDATVEPQIGYVIKWSIPTQGGKNREWQGYFTLAAGETVNLATVAVSSAVPGAEKVYVDLTAAVRDAQAVVTDINAAATVAVQASGTATTAATSAADSAATATQAATTAVAARDATLAASTIVGAGRPDIPATMTSDVAALVNAATSGAVFRSTDGPQGAWEWRKRGTTWRLVDGDTGWRNITALVPGGVTSGTATLRREGNRVWLDFNDLTPASTSGTFWSWALIPAGFQADINYRYAPLSLVSSTDAAGPARLSAGSYLVVYRYNNGTRIKGLISWPTNQSYPATLPGTPA